MFRCAALCVIIVRCVPRKSRSVTGLQSFQTAHYQKMQFHCTPSLGYLYSQPPVLASMTFLRIAISCMTVFIRYWAMQTQKCSANCQIWREKSDILVDPSYIEAAYIPCADLSRIYCVLRDTMIAYMSNIDLGMHAHFHFSANFNFAVLHRAQFWQHCYLYCIALSPAWRPRTFSEHFPFSHLSICTLERVIMRQFFLKA